MTFLFRLAFFIAMAAISLLAFLPDYSSLPPVVSFSDLLNHTFAFTVLYLLYFYAFDHPLKRILVTLFAYAIFIEAVQAFLPTRYASFEDITADIIGLGLGIMLSKGIKRIRPDRERKI